MEDYTVVVEGEVVKKAGKTAIDRFCENAKGKLSTRNTIIMLVTNDDGSTFTINPNDYESVKNIEAFLSGKLRNVVSQVR